MKTGIRLLLVLSVCITLFGCSFRTYYFVRNFSDSPIAVQFYVTERVAKKVNGTSGRDLVTEQLNVRMAEEAIDLKKSEIANRFTKAVVLSQPKTGLYQLEIPARHSADISGFVKMLSTNVRLEFNNCYMMLKQNSTELTFGNDLEALQGFFKLKSFAMGPIVYYLDWK